FPICVTRQQSFCRIKHDFEQSGLVMVSRTRDYENEVTIRLFTFLAACFPCGETAVGNSGKTAGGFLVNAFLQMSANACCYSIAELAWSARFASFHFSSSFTTGTTKETT